MRRSCCRGVLLGLAGAVALSFGAWAQEELSCEEVCYEAEELCFEACADASDADACEARCEDQTDECTQECEEGAE